MKITGYRTLRTVHDWGRPIGDVNGFIASGVTEVPVVILETDEGIEGVGMGSLADLDRIFPALEGQDPRAVSSLYDAMLARVFKTSHAGATYGGIGAFDTALWDLKAKIAGEPLWRLLGAADRFVPGYASALGIALSDDELGEMYGRFAERGFTSAKLKGGRSLERDLERFEVIRQRMPGADLMLDTNESWNLGQAVRFMSRLEESIDLAWIEEPLRRWDAPGHARLASSIRAAVATGENLTGLEQYRPLLDAGGVGIVQAGAVWGITHFLRVAMMAHSRDLPVSPVGLTANHAVTAAAAAVPNHLTAEIQDFGQPFGLALDQEFADGGVVLGDEPGVGIRVDEAAIERARIGGAWATPAGPHVRSPRAGLSLALEND
ncbi:racemase [Microbacterium sorbitolivorans]|uniref:Mandelate racemase/muconate lactonizing enzyme family protein n=1 Tax=Microbacterium sorbitolivorans TaxID=1867410 RepID=A0A367XXK4_9MICO|nr:mandelate racemase/muconate lactonizing enzyme family protein [Microbacterium sorbitolivorans]RCK58343.1 mandelate racemase/muconate lactonizing enzyme family protein [Microbacterium sorbitolivorans]GGF35719.1 racemase [Microbacterium sorbitolivorans]